MVLSSTCHPEYHLKVLRNVRSFGVVLLMRVYINVFRSYTRCWERWDKTRYLRSAVEYLVNGNEYLPTSVFLGLVAALSLTLIWVKFICG